MESIKVLQLKNIVKAHKGFSLIELMVVIAIIAVLAAVAIPAYQQYIVRSKLATLAPIAEDIVAKSIQYFNQHGTYPTAVELGYPNSQYGDNISVDDSAVAAISPLLYTEGGGMSGLMIYGPITRPGCNTNANVVFNLDGTKFPGGMIAGGAGAGNNNNQNNSNGQDYINYGFGISKLDSETMVTGCATYLSVDGDLGVQGNYDYVKCAAGDDQGAGLWCP